MSQRRQQSLVKRMGHYLSSFGPRAAAELVQNLLDHLDRDAEGTALVIAMVKGSVRPEDATEHISVIEHAGDQLRSELVAVLARTLVTPIDREDLYRFSRSIDDLLDELRDFVREWTLLRGPNPDPLLHVLGGLQAALAATKAVVATLQRPSPTASSQLVDALRLATRVRRVHEDEITQLFEGALTMEMMRERELLHRLDSIGIHLVQGLNIIADSFVKRGE